VDITEYGDFHTHPLQRHISQPVLLSVLRQLVEALPGSLLS
jgi:hypothetical protein